MKLSSSLSNKKLSIISQAVFVKAGNQLYCNDKFGRLIDSLASHFQEIVFTCAITDVSNKSFFSEDGKSIYTYEIKSKNIELIVIDLTSRQSPFKMLMGALGRLGAYKKVVGTADLVYIFMPGFSGFLSTLLCFLKKKQYFLYFSSDWIETARFRAKWDNANAILFPPYKLFARFAEYFSTKHAIYSLATGKNFLSRLRKHNDNVYETEPMITIKREDVFHRKTFAEDNKIRLLFVGLIDRRKGVIFLIKALEYLEALGIHTSLIEICLVGARDSDYWKEITDYAKRQGYEKNLHYAGYITNNGKLLSLYRQSDIFVLPSLAEGFPRVIYEAMSQSLPVIASKIDTIYNTLGNNNLVLYANPEDPKSIAECISSLVNDESLRHTLVSNSLKFVVPKLGSDFSSQIVNLINKHIIMQ